MALQLGAPAPEFSLLDGAGNLVSLASFSGKRVVLYFYPKDDTSGCTKEACGFRDSYAALRARDVIVLGISKDDAKSHQRFAAKYELPFPLLCDPDAAVATAYESYGLKKMMGKEYMGIMRHTFIIGKDGTIEKIYLKVKAETHAAEILLDLDTLESGS